MLSREDRLTKVIMGIYREHYAKAEPPADLDKMIKSGEAKKDGFFWNYYLDQEVQNAITEKHVKRHKLKGPDARMVRLTVLLGSSPTSNAPTAPGRKCG